MRIIAFVTHLLLSGVYGYSTYVYVYGINPPKELQIIRENNFGPFKYLTFWNLLLQLLFFTMSALSDLSTQPVHKRKKTVLQQLLDYLFATIVFSTSAFVCTTFWVLYSIDRSLIFPVIYDLFFPIWLNHTIHSLPLLAVLGELLATQHTFPSQRKGFLTVAIFALLYLGWVFYIASTTGHWVYPILAQLTAVGRGGFIGVLSVLIGIFYIMGHGLHALRWGHEDDHSTLIYHKKK